MYFGSAYLNEIAYHLSLTTGNF